ncbi:MAG: S-adenosylmethionine:tRNA ribosyltransferase-isomerase, partial [Bacteroidota bacterium]
SLSEKNPVIATGTTSIRTLESLYLLGAKLILKETENLSNFEIEQWFPYKKRNECSALEAFEAILNNMEKNKINSLYGKTSIIIVPGYEFKICSGLITNFHLPGTTLILLVAAFLGDDLWRKSYESALDNNYRFLSYGDATLCLALGEKK